MYANIEVPQVIFVGHCAYTRDTVPRNNQPTVFAAKMHEQCTYGSAISRSVSLTILFGRAMLAQWQCGSRGEICLVVLMLVRPRDHVRSDCWALV